MAFTIPNEAAAGFADQAEIDSNDLAILQAPFELTGVVSGCAVTAQGSPDMTVAVAAGTVAIAGVLATVTGGNVTITTADATNPRFDLITIDTAGAKAAVAGTAAVNPVYPAIPASRVVLAAVYVPAADTTIASNQITDKRTAVTPKVLRRTSSPTAPAEGEIWLDTTDDNLKYVADAQGTVLLARTPKLLFSMSWDTASETGEWVSGVQTTTMLPGCIGYADVSDLPIEIGFYGNFGATGAASYFDVWVYETTGPDDPAITLVGSGATQYEYKVIAVMPGVEGNTALDSPPSLQTTVFNNATLASGTNQNNLSWAAVPGALGYRIIRQIAGTGGFTAIGGTATTALSAATLTYNDTSSAAGVAYTPNTLGVPVARSAATINTLAFILPISTTRILLPASGLHTYQMAVRSTPASSTVTAYTVGSLNYREPVRFWAREVGQ